MAGEKIFFLHIPKTAGSAFNEVFKASVPDGRFFEHMESRRDLFNKVIDDGQAFFASGHLPFEEFHHLVSRRDVFSITILRNPVQHLISHLKWVKAHGDTNNPERYRLLDGPVAEVAVKLWNTSLTDVQALDRIMSTTVGRQLFDNLQTRYLANSYSGPVGREQIREAINNSRRFDFIFTLEDLGEALAYLKLKFEGVAQMKEKNKARIQEQVDFRSKEVLDFYRFRVAADAALYLNIREYSRLKYFHRK